MKNHNLDRFESDYHIHRFPEQETEEEYYSTCSGCEQDITNYDVLSGEVVEIYGMNVHDTYSCIRKAVEAKTVEPGEEY